MQRVATTSRNRFILVLLVLLVWPIDSTYSESDALVKVDGSSTVFPITEAIAEEFQKENRGAVRVTVGISGTGGGFKKFCRGDRCAGCVTPDLSK